MIDRIAELNRVLLAATELMDDDNVADLQTVLQQCASTVIEGRMPDHELSIEFAQLIGFLTKQGSNLTLTERGQVFLELNPDGLYDLSTEQKRFVLRTCFLHGPLRNETHELLVGFSPAFGKDTFRWSAVDGPPLHGEEWIAEHLRQLELLNRGEGWLEVTAEYVNTVAAFLGEGQGWSEEKFKQYLHEKNEVGALAEDLVLAYEMERLRKVGHIVESHCVRKISKLKVNAGYDIESFSDKSTGLNFNRFIEVKGAKSSSVHFFWSQNEIEIAKKLRDQYWIYFLGGIDLNKGNAKNIPILYRDPLKTILQDASLTKIPQGLIVEGSFHGELATAETGFLKGQRRKQK